MHIPTPHLRKSEKRKASITSVGHEDEVPIEKKPTKSKKKAKTTKQPKAKKGKAKSRSKTPEDPHPQPEASLSRSPSLRSPQAPMSSPQELPTTETETDPTTPTPRRSSRLKNSFSSVSSTWDKCRPYIERINGTIMPLEPQGTKAYYARDGVKVD